MTSCATSTTTDKTLRISGAVDTIPLLVKVAPVFTETKGINLVSQVSRAPLDDVKTGKADAAILGRELNEQETRDFQSTLVAEDAVCILISQRTAIGGIQEGYVMGLGNKSLLQSQSKFAGLKELSLEQIKQLYANVLKINDEQHYWTLTGSYLTFEPYTMEGLLAPKENTDNPGHVLGMWVWNAIPLNSEITPVGMMDSQNVLFEKLGFSGVELKNPAIGFIPSNVGSEEEWISSRFDINPDLAKENSSEPFLFFLMAVSRQVTLRALQHGFGIQTLLIDGIDPLIPENITSGKYPLSRKIYLVTRRNEPVPAVDELLVFLLSDEGQQNIKEASFLALPKNK
jgi:hypothetical protein